MKDDNIEDFTREYLRRANEKLDSLAQRADVVARDVSTLKETVRRIDSRLAAMDSHMAGFYSTARWQSDEIDALKGRLEALEKHIFREEDPA